MKIVLVCGGMHDIFLKIISNKLDIINRNDKLELFEVNVYLEKTNPRLDGILIIDQVFSQWDDNEKSAFYLLIQNSSKAKILLLTNDFNKRLLLESYIKSNNLKLITFDYIRLTEVDLLKAIEYFNDNNRLINNMNDNTNIVHYNERQENTEKKKSFLDRFKSSHKDKEDKKYTATDKLERDINNISKSISRVISISGHRGSGLTSTAINLACEASKRGLKAIVIDLDIEYRGCNAYFSSFNEATNKDDEMNASLIRTLARPQDYNRTCFSINENLWITSLGYSFNDKRLIDQFYNSTKLIGLLSVLRSRFNVIVLDLPLDLLNVFKETSIHIDNFGLCVPNNLYAIISTLRNIEVVLDNKSISYLNSKSKVIVTKYNDRAKFQDAYFIPDKVCEVMTSGISSSFINELDSAGYVPYSLDFDNQIELDIPITNSSAEYQKCYGNILLRLMEGVK